MQDVHSIGLAGGGRLFGAGDRRLRPHHHQALKCPRCDSLNTKFCYYNNYNLSQPRHFCKNCKRYWTKGGVLRNVPVGGGCRKTKRSRPKASSDGKQDRKSNSRSSSECSSLTASTTTAATATANPNAEVLSASSTTSAPTLLNISESHFFIPPSANPGLHSTNPNFEPPLVDQASDRVIFPEIGSFTSLMTTSNDQSLLGFNMAYITSYRLHQQDNGQTLQNQNSDDQWQQQQNMTNSVVDELKMQEITAGFADHVAQIEVSELQKGTNSGGLAAVDWHAGGDQGLFDFTANVDQSYWSQTQWTDNDPPLYLP